MDRYRVDLDELLAFADRLKAFDERADAIEASVDGLVADLHGSWMGMAARAHQDRHDEWMTASTEMRHAAAELKAAADRAHRNYTGVNDTNAAMWP